MRKIAIALLLVLSASLAAGKINTNKPANTQQTNTTKQPKQPKDKSVAGMTTHEGSKGYGVTAAKSKDSKNISDGAAKGQASEGTAPRNSATASPVSASEISAAAEPA